MKSKKKLLVCLLAATMTIVPMAVSAAYNCPGISVCYGNCPAHGGSGGSSTSCPGARYCYGMCGLHRPW